jgi:hypothetical protein
MRADSRLFLRAGVPLLRSYTDDHEYVERIISEAEEELESCAKHMYVRMQCAWARRKAEEET